MIKKNKKYKFPDGVNRTIVDVEHSRGNKMFTNSDYGCYYVDIPFEDVMKVILTLPNSST